MVVMNRFLTLATFYLAILSAPMAMGDDGDPNPLFSSDEIIDVRIVAPFDVITEDRPIEEYVPGQFFFTADDGELVELDVGIRARGHYRRRPDVCPFPPMRLNFKKSQVKDSLFAGQDKLKLVTHCTSGSYFYEQAILAEFLAYRILNQLTDISFRVRLLRVEYATPGVDESVTGYGILIEHDDNVAERIGAAPLVVDNIPLSGLDPDYLNLVSVFQYLIGNTDFSPIVGSPGGDCCHNHAPFGEEGKLYYSIPYDFDMSGFVNAPYAMPNPKMRLDSVQERLYRGRCINNDILPLTLETFVAKRDDIESVVRDRPELSSRKRSEILKYIDQFYRSVAKPRGINRNLVKKCK